MTEMIIIFFLEVGLSLTHSRTQSINQSVDHLIRQRHYK